MKMAAMRRNLLVLGLLLATLAYPNVALAEHDVWWRQAQITNVVDGDTIDAIIDLGYQVQITHRLRLLYIDTPELNSRDLTIREKARQARDYVESWVATYCVGSNFPAQVRSEKDDSFGRYLAEVECSGRTLHMDLLEAGLAVPYED
jgi:micrococcal nuclease